MQWTPILVGVALLLFGRKLYWLFVGGVGFIAGFQIATNLLQGRTDWVILLIALGAGLLGIMAAFFLQRVVVGIAGVVAGGYLLFAFAPTLLHTNDNVIRWVAAAVGGLFGALLVGVLLDPALIILSSLAGATAVSMNVPLDQQAQGLLFIILAIVGILIQSGQYVRDKRPRTPKRPE